MILLDTNVVSELMKAAPHAGVRAWVDAQSRAELYTSTLTQAEILSGIAILPRGKRRDGLARAAQQVFEIEFAGRLLGLSSAAARAYADIVATRRAVGRPIDAVDALVAAVARAADARLATRNTADFERCGVRLVDPWHARP